MLRYVFTLLILLSLFVYAQAPGCENDDCDSQGLSGTPYGTQLASLFGVSAYSNGSCTETGDGCKQCVDFVERYYDHANDWSGNAGVWFDQNEADERDMVRVFNGGSEHPNVGSILCFSGGAYGHIGVVYNVVVNSDGVSGTVTMIDQNRDRDNSLVDLDLTITTDAGGNKIYTVSSFSSSYALSGWLRVKVGHLHDETVSQAIVDRYDLIFGLPIDNGGRQYVHDWSGITLQDFYGDNTGFYDGHTAIMLNSAGTEAFLLKEGFRDFYMNLSDKTGGQYFGPTDLGAPTSDEEFNELDGNTYQYFDYGYMKYVPSYYSNTPGVVEVWLGSTKIASNTALMTIAGTGGSGGSNGTGAVSIYQWTIPSSGVEHIAYDFTVKLKNLESESVTYESIRLRAYGPTIASWEWNNVTVAGDAFYEQTVSHTFADSGNYTFKVFVTKDSQSWQIGAIAPEVQERVFPVLAGNPNTTYNPDLLEVTAVSIVPGLVPLQYDSTVVTATVVSTSGDTTEQIVRFELETQDQRFTMFGDTSVTLMPYDSLTFSAVMDPMYNLGTHELWVSAHDGLDYQDIDGAQNPRGFSVYQPWGIDSVHVSSVFLSNAVGDSIKREHIPESQVYVRVALDHDEDDGQKVVLPDFRVRLYDSYGVSYWNVNAANDTLSFAQDTVWLSPIFTLPTDVSRYEVQVLSQGENLSTLATVRYPYTVTVANPQAEQTTTVIDTVAAFDGHKDRVEAASGGMSGNQFTFEGKVYLNALSTGTIISNWHNEHNNPVFELGLTPSKIYCFISGTADVAEYPVSLELDRWYHIAATYNGSAGIQLFLDGNLVATKPGNCGSTWQADYPWYIGGSDDNMYYYNRAVINGYVDEVRVWNRTRTQSQINATKDVTLSTEYYATADSGLIGYWPFNDDLTDVSTHQRGGIGKAQVTLANVTTVTSEVTTCDHCDTLLIYADPADVVVQDGNYGYQTSWSYHHDLASGELESVDATVAQIGVSQFDGPAWGDIRRYALPFDTSVLPDTVEVVAATLHMHVVDYRNSQGQSHFLGLTRGTYDLPVTAGDYSSMGAISNPIEGAERLYFAPTDFALHLDSTVVIELDSTGRSWIDLNNMTTFALRQGDDILDMTVSEYAGVWGRGTYVQVATADHADVAKRPVLRVVYTTSGNGLAKQSAGDDEVISLLPTEYNLHQNHPNPFNPTTTIAFDLPHDTHVKIVVYNLLGQEVARLVDDRHNAGYHHVQWDARNVASGMYFYRISTESFHKVKKMLLIR